MVVRTIVNLDEILIMNSTLQGSLRFQVSGWNTRNRRRIKQLGISFSYIFLFFPIRVVGDHVYSSRGKSSALSPAVNDSPDFKGNQILKHMLENLGFVINPFSFLCRSSILWESLWTPWTWGFSSPKRKLLQFRRNVTFWWAGKWPHWANFRKLEESWLPAKLQFIKPSLSTKLDEEQDNTQSVS